MQREEFFKKELVEELTRVVKMMKDEVEPERKIYLFSAAYGITSRTFRYSFSKEILLADFALQTTYNLLADRWQRIKAGDITVEITTEHFEKLEKSLSELISLIKEGKPLQPAVEDILAIGFSTTGPGNYLREKGDLEI